MATRKKVQVLQVVSLEIKTSEDKTIKLTIRDAQQLRSELTNILAQPQAELTLDTIANDFTIPGLSS